MVKSHIMVKLTLSPTRTLYAWSQADFNMIRHTIQKLCDNFVASYNSSFSVNVLWDSFLKILNTCLELIPTRNSLPIHRQPWITRNLKRLSRRKQRAYNRARITNDPSDWLRYNNIKKQTRQECRSAYNNYVQNLINPNTNAISKRLWSFMKSKKHDHTGVGPLVHDGTMYTDPQDKADLMAKYFSSVFTTENTDNIPTLSNGPFPDMPPIQIYPQGIQYLLNNLDANKSGGPDKLPARFLKEVAAGVVLALSIIYQASLDQGVLPAVWKTATIVPIHKKGSQSACSNYRPISLTCICSKVLEHIIYSNISDHLGAHNILCEEQHGFRNHKSCESQLINTVHDFVSCLNDGGQCDALFLDFKKAFDKVPHSCLFYKLNHYGTRGPLLLWIKEFLCNQSQRVVLGNKESFSTDVLSGLPQGTVLAPLLFLLYVNDLPHHVYNKIKLYADDVLLYSPIYSVADCAHLQEDLNLLYQWSVTWLMDFNPLKCEFLRVTNKKNPTDYCYYIGNSIIKQVAHSKYLGVTIDEKLTWNEHILAITSKARQINAFLRQNFYQCLPHIKCNLFKSMVRPIIEFASPV